MKPLPPTLREKRRYVLIRILGLSNPVQKDIYRAVLDAVTSVFGDVGSAKMHPAVVWSEKDCAIVRCTRETERDLCAALACVCRIAGEPAACRAVTTSGTILGAKKKTGFEDADMSRYPGYSVRGKKADGEVGVVPRFVTVDDLEK